MRKESAGLLMYRLRSKALEVFLAHPGGPFWRNRDLGGWTIPKGEIELGEEPLDAARREFEEEIGLKPEPPFLGLGIVTQKAGKKVHAWAFEGDCVIPNIRSNLVEIEWPRKSGAMMTFPEIDRAEFFDLSEAREKINSAQILFLVRLTELLGLAQSTESPRSACGRIESPFRQTGKGRRQN